MQVLCGQCGHLFEAPRPRGNQAIQCPGCGNRIRLDGPAETPDDTGAEEGFAQAAHRLAARQVVIICEQCGQRLLTTMRNAGKRRRCPSCGGHLRVPYPDDDAHFEAGQIEAHADAAPPADEDADRAQEQEPGQELIVPEQDDLPVEALPESSRGAAAKDLASRAAGATPDQRHRPPAVDGQEDASAPDAQTAEPEETASPSARERRASPAGRWILIAAAGAGMLLLVMAMVMAIPWLLGNDEPAQDANATSAGLDAGPPGPAPKTKPRTQPQAQPAPKPRPTTQPTVAGATRPRPMPRRRKPEPPAKPRPRVEVIEARKDVFALGSGHFPAGADRAYYRLRVRFFAGDDPWRLSLASPQLALQHEGTRYRCLGVPGSAEGALPVRARPEGLKLAPGKQTDRWLLFEAPTDLDRAELIAPGLGEPLSLTFGDGADDAPRPAGRYREQPPRSLQPMLRDPVMAAIQGAVRQRLEIRPADDGWELALPDAGVSGTVGRGTGGMYPVELHHDGHSLQARLRMFHRDGHVHLLLYLADRPFHQILFGKL